MEKINTDMTKLHIMTMTALAAAGLLGASAMQTPPTTEYADSAMHIDLNPVVVTGTGVHQRLKSTPVPVEVITGSEIKSAGLNDLQQALTMMVPSLSFSPSAMGSYLRLNGLTNNHVLILVNGRKLTGDISGNVDLGQIDINLVKRVEVLNGAASTLYGSDAVGGVINIIMAEPEDESEFTSNSRYTTKNRFDQSAALTLRAGRIGSLTSYSYSHSDGWQNSHLTESGDELVETIAQLSLGYTSNNLMQRFTYEASDRLELYAEGTYYHRLLDRPLERKDVTGGLKYNTMSESYSWAGGGTWSLGSLGSLRLDYNGRRFTQYYKYGIASGDYEPGDYSLTKRQNYNEVELKGVLNLTENSNTVIGADYRRDRLRRPDSDLDKGLGTVSVYGQHEQRMGEHVTGIAGVRYDNYQDLGGRVTPKIAAMAKAGDFNVRATYAMGYRAPGIEELYYHMFKPMGSRYVVSLGNPDLKAESSDYVGLNMEYRTGRFSASVTGYLNFVRHMVTSGSTKFTAMTPERQAELIKEFPDIANTKPSLVSVKEYYNFSKARVRGVEANLSWNPTRDLSLGVNYAFAYGRGLNDDGTWQTLNRSIRHTATVNANYAHTWGSYTLNVNLTGRVQSKTYYPGDADGDAPGYGIWNLTSRHTLDSFRSFTLTPGIGVDNILNRRDNRPLNKNFALYSPGRSVVVSLTLKLK